MVRVEPKKLKGHDRKNSGAWRYTLELSNSFRRQCVLYLCRRYCNYLSSGLMQKVSVIWQTTASLNGDAVVADAGLNKALADVVTS